MYKSSVLLRLYSELCRAKELTHAAISSASRPFLESHERDRQQDALQSTCPSSLWECDQFAEARCYLNFTDGALLSFQAA